jgi:hypothetical protein
MIGTAHTHNLDMNMYAPSKTCMSSCEMTAKIDWSKRKLKELDNFTQSSQIAYQAPLNGSWFVTLCRQTDIHSNCNRWSSGLETLKNVHPPWLLILECWWGPQVCIPSSLEVIYWMWQWQFLLRRCVHRYKICIWDNVCFHFIFRRSWFQILVCRPGILTGVFNSLSR